MGMMKNLTTHAVHMTKIVLIIYQLPSSLTDVCNRPKRLSVNCFDIVAMQLFYKSAPK